jgi:NADH-quinone oxidoreductase subunit H
MMTILFYFILHIILLILTVLLSVAYFTLAERNIMSAVQRRRGPNVVGIFGLLQPLADGLKLFVKEPVKVHSSNIILFIIAPNIAFILALLSWGVIPFNEGVVLANINVGVLFLLATSSLGIYGVIIAGWSSNSKYPFIGAIRSAAQMISYEISIGFIIVNVVICAGSLNLSEIVESQSITWYWKPLNPMMLLFVICMLAETNRHPFDLPEAEAEIVAGYNTEYSGMLFALFYLGEYANMLIMSTLAVILFFGGWLPPFEIAPFTWISGSIWFGLKTLIFIIVFIMARACLPRYRYDQLMHLGWKVFLPFSFAYCLLTAGILIAFDGLPPNNLY